MRNSNIDLVKLFMASCVVTIHVSKLSNYSLPPVLDYMVKLAVPFFYVVSGYYIYPILFGKSAGGGRILLKYIKMYVIWTLVYLPFAALYYLREDYSFLGALKDYLGNFILTGETPLAWHMWYLHTLIISVAIIIGLVFTKTRIEVLSILIFTIVGFLDFVVAFDVPAA